MTKNKKAYGIIIGILVLAIVSRFDSIIAPSVAEIKHAFPDTDPSNVESIVSIGGSAAMVSAILFGKLLEKLSYKLVAFLGASFVAVGGLAPIIFHDSVAILLVFAVITGFGTGIITTVLPSLSAHFFKGEQLSGLLGKIVAVQDGSSMIVMYIGGLLAMQSWIHNYYIYGLAILAIIFVLLFVPNETANDSSTSEVAIEEESENVHQKKQHLGYIFSCLFLGFLSILLVAVMYNKLAIYIDTYNLGGPDAAGKALMFNTGSSIVIGLSINYIKKIFGNYTLSFGFILMGVGAFLFILTPSIWLVSLAAFLIGAGSAVSMTNLPFMLSNLAESKKYPFIMGCFSAITSLGFTSSTWFFKSVTALFMDDALIGTFQVMLVLSFVIAIVLAIVNFQKKVEKYYQ
jgi:MFS family permease